MSAAAICSSTTRYTSPRRCPRRMGILMRCISESIAKNCPLRRWPEGAVFKFLVFTEFGKQQSLIPLQRPVDAPLIGEQQKIPPLKVLHLFGIRGQVKLSKRCLVQPLVVYPAYEGVGEGLHMDLHVILVLHAVLEHVEL